jgi:hypothetical protein
VYVLDWGVARVTGEHETILGNDRTLESGDRDLERRRTLAAELLAQAREAAADPKRHAEAVMINLGAQAAFLRRPCWVLISLILTAFFLPIVFEQVGWFPVTMALDHDAMLVYSQALTLEHGDRVQLLLWVSYAGILTAAGLMSMRVGKERRTAQRESLRRTWHLENLWLRRPSHTSG